VLYCDVVLTVQGDAGAERRDGVLLPEHRVRVDAGRLRHARRHRHQLRLQGHLRLVSTFILLFTSPTRVHVRQAAGNYITAATDNYNIAKTSLNESLF
jgi:hypothetical protein